MFVLAIDTSSAATTAALARVDGAVEVVAEQVHVDARAHGEQLAPAIAAVLDAARVEITQLGAIVAGLGPGPFTGLRVGLVTAAVLADSLGVPAYGVCSLDGIGGTLDEPGLLVAGDARRREVYWAAYDHGVRVAGPDVAQPANLVLDGYTAMAGAGARLYAAQLGLPLRDREYPDPGALITAAHERIVGGAPSEPLTPLYLRRPDAVEPGVRKPVSA